MRETLEGANNEKVPSGGRSPAFAEQFYVAYDGKRCEMFSHKPPDKMNLLGTFNSKDDAEKAMKDMK